MRLKIKINKNDVPALYIAAYYALQALQSIVSRLFQNSTAVHVLVGFGVYSILILMLLKMLDNIKIFVVAELVAGVVFFISACMGNVDYAVWVRYYRRIVFAFIPVAVTAYSVVDRKKLLSYLRTIAIIATPAWVLTAYLSYRSWDTSYDMGLGYIMMFAALVLLTNFTIYFHMIDIIFAAIICSLVLFVGSRGPFICIFAFFMIEFIICKQYDFKRKAIFITIISLLLFTAILNIDNILFFAEKASQNLGFNSRSLALIMQGKAVSHDSGRLWIWRYIMNLIDESPLLGYGVIGGWIDNTTYPHNIILEFILSFGYPIGIFLLMVILLITLNGIRCKDKYNSAIAILFVSFCTQLFVTQSFLGIWQFFACIAFCMPMAYSSKTLKPRTDNHYTSRENRQFSTVPE